MDIIKDANRLFRQLCTDIGYTSDKMRSAYEFALQLHGEKTRKNGTSYIIHVIQTARIMIEWRLPESFIIAALLHHAFAQPSLLREIETEQLQEVFGPDIVANIKETSRLSYARQAFQANGAYKELGELLDLSMDLQEHPQVILVKLASGLETARALGQFNNQADKNKYAQLILQAYPAITGRLGMHYVKREIEDSCMRALYPQQFKWIKDWQDELITKKYTVGIENFIIDLTTKLQARGIKCKIRQERRGIYSRYHDICQKRILEITDKEIREYLELPDLFRLIVVAETVDDCYMVLRDAHTVGTALSPAYDQISTPKPNGYAAIRTNVKYGYALAQMQKSVVLNLTIQSTDMFSVASYGVTSPITFAEWYKAPSMLDRPKDLQETNKYAEQNYIHKLIESITHQPSNSNLIHVFTLRGELRKLILGATPLDFAYQIHEQVGNRYGYAKVNGIDVPMDYELRHMDIVEIVVDPSTSPKKEWLAHAREEKTKEKIRQYLRSLPVTQGHDLLIQELKTVKIEAADYEVDMRLREIAKIRYGTTEKLFEALGLGLLSPDTIIQALQQRTNPSIFHVREFVLDPTVKEQLGVRNPRPHLAKCCNPIYPQEIVGYRRGSKITVHTKSCRNVREIADLVPIEWSSNEKEPLKIVHFLLEGYDRAGLARDVTQVISNHTFNMREFQAENLPDHKARIMFAIEIRHRISQQLLNDLRSINGIISATSDADIFENIFEKPAEQYSFLLTSNPYQPGRPVKHKEMFFGRKEELARYLSCFNAHSSSACLSICAQKRSGKTSFAMQIAQELTWGLSYITVYIDLAQHEQSNEKHIFQYIYNRLQREFMKNGVVVDQPKNQSVEELCRSLESSILDCYQKYGKKVVIMLDEFDATTSAYERQNLSKRFFVILRSWTQSLPCTIVIVGSNYLPERLSKIYPDFVTSFGIEWLAPLDQDSARALIIQPTYSVLEYESGIVDKIIELTACFPYYIHQVCFHLFNQLVNTRRTLVTSADLNMVVDKLVKKDANIFHHLWDRDCPEQKLILTQIGRESIKERSWLTSEQIGHLAAIDLRTSAHLLYDLCKRDAIEKKINNDQALYRIRLPLFSQWIYYNWILS